MDVYNRCSQNILDSLFCPIFPPINQPTSCSDHIEDDFSLHVTDQLHSKNVHVDNKCFFLNQILFLHSDDYHAAGLVSGFWFLMCFVKNELTLT